MLSLSLSSLVVAHQLLFPFIMKKSAKRLESDDPPTMVTEKRPKSPVLCDDDDEELLDGLSIGEEMVAEVMKSLEEELSCPTGINPPSSYVTINGNEETCGPSFSDSASSVMADVDMRGIGILNLMASTREFSASFPLMENGRWALEEESEYHYPEVEVVSGDGSNGCDSGESDDEWLARILSWAPPEIFEV
uniref:Uncharacterized protein n=1 Tax=Nelumbo nucifera TaxID=4432 RepID=A0A822ZRH4_NELNU|nr:TPA_asm: hypothetical protein HUJ06_002658 [Nelumbo nucifera]